MWHTCETYIKTSVWTLIGMILRARGKSPCECLLLRTIISYANIFDVQKHRYVEWCDLFLTSNAINYNFLVSYLDSCTTQITFITRWILKKMQQNCSWNETSWYELQNAVRPIKRNTDRPADSTCETDTSITGVLHWLLQLARKFWFSNQVVSNLVRSL